MGYFAGAAGGYAFQFRIASAYRSEGQPLLFPEFPERCAAGFPSGGSEGVQDSIGCRLEHFDGPFSCSGEFHRVVWRRTEAGRRTEFSFAVSGFKQRKSQP